MSRKPSNRDRPEPFEAVRLLLEGKQRKKTAALLKSLDPAAAVRALLRLEKSEQNDLIELLDANQAADLLEDLPDSHAASLIENITTEKAADIMAALSSDHGADLLSTLKTENTDAILNAMSPDMAGEVRKLIAYPADVAGGLMGPEFYSFPETGRCGDFLQELAQRREQTKKLPQRVVLVDALLRPTGTIEIAELLLAEPNEELRTLSQPVETIPVTAGIEALETYFDRHETLGAPVVDENGILVGRLRRRAVAEARAEIVQARHLKAQGIIGGEELRTMPLLSRSRRRLSWLSLNILLNVIAASVIAMFQETLSAVIALAIFLPIVSDMSGCSGNQAVAVSMRELTLGIIQPRDLLRVWWKEASVGILNGLALGLLISLVAYVWQGSPVLGLVVGLALCLNTIIAVSIGGTVPLILRAWNADPAVASGPVLTTITDVCGFMLLLGLATLALPWLT